MLLTNNESDISVDARTRARPPLVKSAVIMMGMIHESLNNVIEVPMFVRLASNRPESKLIGSALTAVFWELTRNALFLVVILKVVDGESHSGK